MANLGLEPSFVAIFAIGDNVLPAEVLSISCWYLHLIFLVLLSDKILKL